jgi:hypothetical protein
VARIKTYPTDFIPTIQDKVVGSDLDESSATKNYRIGDIISLEGSTIYVPYTGALSDVDLGGQSLFTTDLHLSGSLYDNLGGVGSLGDMLSITSNGVEWSPINLDVFVPYTGAVLDVDLGAQSLFTTNIDVSGHFRDSIGFTGSSGQILSSTVSGTQWIDQPLTNAYVPYVGAILSVDLGAKSLKTFNLTVNGSLYDRFGLNGDAGQVLVSTGNRVEWADVVNAV